MAKPVVRLQDQGDAYLGEIELPCGNGRVRASALGAYPWDALKRAGSLAVRIASDPALAPLIPPQAMATAQAVRTLSKLATSSPETLRRITPQLGPAHQVVAKSLLARRGIARIKRSARAKALEARAMSPARATTSHRVPAAQAAPHYDDHRADQYGEQYGGEQYGGEQYEQPQYEPQAQARDAAEHYATQAWGEGAFAEGSFPEAEAEPQYAEWSDDDYDNGQEVPIYQEDYSDDAES